MQNLTALLKNLHVPILMNEKNHWLIEAWYKHQHLLRDVGVDHVDVSASVHDQTAGVDSEVVTPRLEVENEAVSPWSIHSPEAKRLKI